MQQETKIEELTDNVKEYLNTRYEIMVLKGTGKAATLASGSVFWLLISIITLLSVLFLSFAAACYLSNSEAYSGFLIVGGAYVIIGLIVAIFKKSMVIKPFRNKIIREILKEVE